MRSRLIAFTAGIVLLLLTQPTVPLAAQGAAALRGTVQSSEEGKMEGVLVTVRPDGGNYTVTVVSDAKGQYSFPRSHVPAGRYTVAIRAIGYDGPAAPAATVAPGKTATLNLALTKTKDLSAQLTSLDFVTLFPLTDAEKDKLVHQAMSCNYCHNYRRILRSKHDVAGLVRAQERMKTYYVDGTAVSEDGRGRIERWTKFGDSTGRPTPTPPTQGGIGNEFWSYSTNYPDKGAVPMKTFAEYFAKVNMGAGRTALPFELKPVLPRPTGKATRVIITQWDAPDKGSVLHDSAIDKQGNLWYGDESGHTVGMLNPKTNTFKEFPLMELPGEHLQGSRDPAIDEDGNVWFPMRVPGGAAYLTKLDPATGKMQTVEGASSQFISEGAGNKIWALGTGTGTIRIDARTAAIDGKFPNVAGYQKVVSGAGVVCGADSITVECLDTTTGEKKTYPLPGGPNAYGRRGKMDPQDRYWFAEYSADKVAMLDLKSGKVTEWPLRKYSTPYTASMPDQKGFVWAPSNMSDRMMKLDPRTGELVEFLMPGELDTKEIQIDPTVKNRSVILFANKRTARIARIEVLD
jgi:streptogramin lyase